MRREREGFARLTWWLACLATVALAIPTASRLLGLERGPFAYLVALVPWFTVALIVVLTVTLILKAWPLAGVLAALSIVGVSWLVPLYVGSGAQRDVHLTVATVNLTFGSGGAESVVAMAYSHDVDLLSVQELTPEALAALGEAGLDDRFPYREVRAEPGVTGTGLWSMYPLQDAVELDGFYSQNIRTIAVTPDGPVTVYAIHPLAPGPFYNGAWRRELALLASELAEVTGPVIVAGDFNTTRDHRAFRSIEALGYIDTMNQAGAGFLPTFPVERGAWELVTLDHVMTRDTPLLARDVKTITVPGADHRAVIVTFVAIADAAAPDQPVG